MHSEIKHIQITAKVDQISEGNISIQSISQVLKKTSSSVQKPSARNDTEHILEPKHSCPLELLAERLQVEGASPGPQVSADIWLFKNKGGEKRLWLSPLLR